MLWKRIFERPVRLLAVSLASVLVVAVALLGGMAWRNLGRIERIRAHVAHTARIQQVSLELQQSLLAELTIGVLVDPAVRAELRREVAEIRALDAHLHPQTGERLDRLHRLLEERPMSRRDQIDAIALIRDVVTGETGAQARLLARISADTRRELVLVIPILAALVGLGLLGYWNLRQRVVRPLDDLQALLGQLASGEFHAVEADQVHPLLAPLFANYNELVSRLAELEEQHRARARTLESEVRSATRALMAQQRTLARAERLAAVGETAAGLAHELRNPLAGVLMSLGNLRRDVSDPDLAERLTVAVSELERLTHLLNQYLSTARHTPEQPRSVNLHKLVVDLLALLRYQVPERVRLECRIADDLQCMIPKDRIRQALLNLILNSVQAVGEQAGAIAVSAERDDRSVTLSVSDDGPGFPADLLRAGAQAFQTRRETGTGLGLAMVRRVAVDLGGELRLENRQPRGACVSLVLPCRDG